MAKIDQLITTAQAQIDQINTTSQLDDLRLSYLGRNGQINQLFKSLTKDQLKKQGASINQAKIHIDQLLNSRKTFLLEQLSKTSIDVTIPGLIPQTGHLHLITQAIEDISRIFLSLGYSRRRYPEVETDWYYAEGLNIPKDHPARDDQETFYFTSDVVLTAHTSNGQLREMETHQPPIKMLNIGKTYRRQADASHAPMFHQFEGLVIDHNINITHLIGTLDYFAQSYFGPNRKTRLRPHHFQFTEPSFEVDITCGVCEGRGDINGVKCRICKAGWLELGGAGMVHPQVLTNGGLNPIQYSGFAFGWGVERVLMMKHHLTADLRDIYSLDLKFLSQF